MDKRLSILHIAECAGGVERYLQMLLPRLEIRDFRQYLICSQNYDRRKYQGVIDGVEQIDMAQTFSPSQIISKVLSIRKIIKQLQPDVVYCHSSFAGGLGRLAALGLPCKIVYNPHGWSFNMK